MQEQKFPVPISFPAIKAEQDEVSCFCAQLWTHFPNIQKSQLFFFLSVCPSLL
jgi:hypothetical protein